MRFLRRAWDSWDFIGHLESEFKSAALWMLAERSEWSGAGFVGRVGFGVLRFFIGAHSSFPFARGAGAARRGEFARTAIVAAFNLERRMGRGEC